MGFLQQERCQIKAVNHPIPVLGTRLRPTHTKLQITLYIQMVKETPFLKNQPQITLMGRDKNAVLTILQCLAIPLDFTVWFL